MSNVHTIKVTYKRTSPNKISKFIGANKERILIDKASLDNVELIEGKEYILKIFKETWFSYLTSQLGALRNIISIEPLEE
ncbi:hypothetical protein SAMN02745136_05269 [Anaerocolumna jejuensis DSM 15929]|uniref:Uncharacterized protein n=1 Tax=Anaerocolumna jejuensis DSM 15929 TaxID=1121322 RepID=A0A1M7BVR9_9FIRM|nr:hypothetical protein [Anaerocolumna jejuensis]SHL59027.1 hypothetical protein SAMN02745136_05269 [Anaerocolumna jejuensis DSM 15929]